MAMLDRKLVRDLGRLKGQGLAIALVMAAGIALLIMAQGTHGSLLEIRDTYYERTRFAHVFAELKRAPLHVAEEMAAIDGVAAVNPRVTGRIILDIDGMASPASGRLVSLPLAHSPDGQPRLNRLHIRLGRLPARGARDEVAVNQAFADAHGFKPGMKINAIVNGRKRQVRIVGVVLSPEYVYAVAPAELIPDDRRFGVLWMADEEAAAAFDMQGAFNSVTLLLRNGADEKAVIADVDRLLGRYGGFGAHGRKDQLSHAFLDSELTQLEGMAKIIPPIFLGVAAFLINMTLARLVALEREQIGLLKALGYSSWAVAGHYLKLVLAIASVGVFIGIPLGGWLGRLITGLYTEFYHFPFLFFVDSPAVYLIGITVTLLSAIAGALRAVLGVAALPPAVAMSPPSPTRYSHMLGETLLARLPQVVTMILRHIIRFPVRALTTSLGMSGGVALLFASLSMLDSMEFMIDVTYFRTLRYDTAVEFTGLRQRSIVDEVTRLPGVLRAEPHRSVGIVLRHGHVNRRLAITGLARNNRLHGLLDPRLRPMQLPDSGLAITEKIAELFDLKHGDLVDVEVMEGRKQHLQLRVSAIMQGYLGLSIYMDLDRLNALMGDGNAVTGVDLSIDSRQEDRLNALLKTYPAVAGLSQLRVSEQKFRETMAENLNIVLFVYVMMAAVITFGVVYNAARINLSERGRELASLRVLGFTTGEVSFILLGELAILVLLAIPPGWALGLLIKLMINQSLDNELFRVPFYVARDKFALSALTCIVSASLSAYVVRKRINELDLIEVLKTRE